MTIRKKDGNVYVLEGPNKLTKNQQDWDPKKLIFHNFSWQEIIWNNRIEKKPEPIKPSPIISKPIVEELILKEKQQTANIEEIKKQILQEQEQKKEEVYSKDFPILKYKVLMHCLPAKTKSHKDSLYGDVWQTVSYGKKFIFPSVVLNSNDLQIEFWTSDPNNQISEKSIVFPFAYEVYNQSNNSYDRVPFDEHRWWKITSKENKQEGGWVFYAIPSQDQPDFSD
jgi:hypothetical protein